jgi:hypothetical protein
MVHLCSSSTRALTPSTSTGETYVCVCMYVYIYIYTYIDTRALTPSTSTSETCCVCHTDTHAQRYMRVRGSDYKCTPATPNRNHTRTHKHTTTHSHTDTHTHTDTCVSAAQTTSTPQGHPTGTSPATLATSAGGRCACTRVVRA